MVKGPVGIIGAGLVGLAAARQLAQSGVPVVVWEKEAAVAQHQSGHNSGVVHAGIYYQPGSAKAKNCRRGVELLHAYCAGRGLPWDERGKLVVARDEAETQRLREIERRAQANGAPGVRWLDGPSIRALEPDVAGVAALLSPTTAIVDFPAIARAFAGDVISSGGQILTSTPVTAVRRHGDGVHVITPSRTQTVSRLVISPACRRTCSPGRRATWPRRRSSRSGASTCGCGPRCGRRCTTSSIPCPTPRTRSSAST